MVQEAHGAQVLLDPDYRPKNVLHSNKNTGVCCRATPSHFGPHYPWFCVRAKSRKLRCDLVDLWEGTLPLYYNKLSLKMMDCGSRSTWGPKSMKIQITEPKT